MQRQSVRGFTLIEVMITVVIVAILASLAIASYRNHILRANRTAAESFMYELASKQERYLLDNRQYTFTLSDLSTVPSDVSPNYTISVADNDTSSSVPGYVITATPIAGTQQATDTCGVVTLNHLGQKTPPASGSTLRCWQ